MDAFAKYQKLFADLAEKKAAVGWFPSSVYPVDPEGFLGKYQSGGDPVASIAFLQEFGSKTIPARPFMRPTIAKQSKHWGVIVKNLIKPDAQAEDIIELVGLRMQGDIRKTITEITTPPLSEFTLEQRLERGNNSEKPLNDTGYMLATLTSMVQG
jgi:hypothetical protein